jgi:hypothetical protein
VLVTTGLALCAFLRRFFPDSGQGARSQGTRSIRERASILILILASGASLVAAASASASAADLLLFWGPKAQAFAAARTIDAGFLRDPFWTFLEYMHTSYPPLVTNLTALTSMAAGRFAWGAATLVFPILMTLLAAALPSLLRLAAPPGMAMAAAALAVAASGFLGDALDIGGNGDMPLLFFETLAAALLVGSWALEKGGQLFAGLMLAGAASTKVGLALLLSGFFVVTYLHGDPNPRLWTLWSAGRTFLPMAGLLTIAAAARSAKPVSETS